MAPRSTAEEAVANVAPHSTAQVRAAKEKVNVAPRSTAEVEAANVVLLSIALVRAARARANAVPHSTAQVAVANAARRLIVQELEANAEHHLTVQEDSYAHFFVTSIGSSKI